MKYVFITSISSHDFSFMQVYHTNCFFLVIIQSILKTIPLVILNCNKFQRAFGVPRWKLSEIQQTCSGPKRFAAFSFSQNGNIFAKFNQKIKDTKIKPQVSAFEGIQSNFFSHFNRAKFLRLKILLGLSVLRTVVMISFK